MGWWVEGALILGDGWDGWSVFWDVTEFDGWYHGCCAHPLCCGRVRFFVLVFVFVYLCLVEHPLSVCVYLTLSLLINRIFRCFSLNLEYFK
jgi:hypothetical protein